MSGPLGSSQWVYSTGGGAFYPHEIGQSLRFNDNDSAYLSRTPASAGNRKTWTWSGWVKRGNLGTPQTLFSAESGGSGQFAQIVFQSSDNAIDFLGDYNGGVTARVVSSPLYRDPSAWYHIVAVFDTTNATSTDRLRLYINGVRVTSFQSTTFPAINFDGYINTTNQHRARPHILR
jgi:hypothetical protein